MKHILLFACSLIVFRAFSCNPNPSDLPFTPEPPDTIYGSAMLCEDGDSLLYSTDSIGGTLSYTWSVPTGWTILSGDGTTAILVNPGAAGQNGAISVSALDTSGNSSAFSLDVTVNPLPEVFAGNDTALCSGSFPYTLIASGNATSYSWPGNPPSITIAAPATAVLTGTLNGCTNSDTVTISNAFCGGLEENDAAFIIYPNPASETIALTGTFLQENTAYRIYSSDGRLVANGSFSSANAHIAVDFLEPGSYFVSIGTSTVSLEIVR